MKWSPEFFNCFYAKLLTLRSSASSAVGVAAVAAAANASLSLCRQSPDQLTCQLAELTGGPRSPEKSSVQPYSLPNKSLTHRFWGLESWKRLRQQHAIARIVVSIDTGIGTRYLLTATKVIPGSPQIGTTQCPLVC